MWNMQLYSSQNTPEYSRVEIAITPKASLSWMFCRLCAGHLDTTQATLSLSVSAGRFSPQSGKNSQQESSHGKGSAPDVTNS